MPIAKKIVWAVVMDGGKAKIFAGPRFHLQLLSQHIHSHLPNKEHEKDRPGRSFESMGQVRHAYESQTDWHERQKQLFAESFATIICRGYEEKQFNVLYLFSPAKLHSIFKTVLENKLSALSLKDLEIHMVDKDLTHHKYSDIQEMIRDVPL